MVEALIAISILLIAVVGPLSLLSTALRDSVYIRNEITANYLAQEGLEVITYFNDTGAVINLGVFCIDGTEEQFANAVTEVSDGDDCVLRLMEDGSDQYYGHGSGSDTIFTRYIEIENLTNESVNNLDGREYKIISTIEWNNVGFASSKSIVYETHLFVSQ